jgi:hypothetical protein
MRTSSINSDLRKTLEHGRCRFLTVNKIVSSLAKVRIDDMKLIMLLHANP